MSHIITELKNLSLGEVTNNDFIIVTEVTNSLGQIETKTMNLGEYTKYNITSSNVLNTFRSGSHSGTFIGNLLGSSLSASISTTASFSNTTNYLSSSSNNGTASYSINANSVPINSNSSYALTSSYATNSVTSSRASYVKYINPIDGKDNITYKADTSDFSNNSISASSSQKTNYLNFNGTDNGIVYHAINSDTSSYASIANSLSYPNTSTAHRSITSSYSSTSISASYSPSSSYADFSNRSLVSLSEAHAYITLIMDQTTTNILSVKEYYNINHVVIQQSSGSNEINIIFQFENDLSNSGSAIIKVDCSSRVQFNDPAAYTNNTDLYDYRTSVVLKADNNKDTVPMDMIIGTSCSRSVAKITLISKEFGQTTKGISGFFSFLSSLFCFGSEQAEQHETPAAGSFSKCYISLIVLDGGLINDGKNYPETPPTTIPPKC